MSDVSIEHLFVDEDQDLPNDYIDSEEITTEAEAIHQEKQRDQVQQADSTNVDPVTTEAFVEPDEYKYVAAFKKNFATKQTLSGTVARVFAKPNKKSLKAAQVMLKDRETDTVLLGRVAAVGNTEFAVLWRDNTLTVEPKSRYELVKVK